MYRNTFGITRLALKKWAVNQNLNLTIPTTKADITDMTTLMLDDKLAERLTTIAAAQGRTLDDLAIETLERLAATIPPPVSEPTEGQRLLAFLKPHWEAQTTNPEQYSDNAAQPSGDRAEELLQQHWADDLRRENSL